MIKLHEGPQLVLHDDVLASVSEHPEVDLLLLDWNMPNLNGLDLVKKLRADGRFLSLPIIMITSEAAKYNVDRGAQIIDINMGCPAKKVCNVMAGSALLQQEELVARILDAVVKAVDVPVTLKTRLGYCNGQENILRIGRVHLRAFA